MKKLFNVHATRLLLAFLCIITGFAQGWAGKMVYAYSKSGAPYIHYWGGSNGTSWSSRPQLSSTALSNWYSIDIGNNTNFLLINNNSGDGDQTGDFSASSNYTITYYKGGSAYSSNTAPSVYTVYVKASSAPYLHAWISGTGTNLLGDWAGTQFTTTETLADGETWYKMQFYSIGNPGIIFSSDSNGSNKSDDKTVNATTTYWEYSGSTATQVSDPSADTRNAFTVYVEADAAPYLYAWTGDGKSAVMLNGNWPGTQMSATETVDGRTYYKKVIRTTEDAIKLIFNNGKEGNDKKQTGDITQSDAVAYYQYDGATNYSTLTTFTAYVRNMDEGTYKGKVPYIYMWNNSDQPYSAWRGEQGVAEVIDGIAWYKRSVTTFESSVNLLFILDAATDASGATQSADINQTDAVRYYEYYPAGDGDRYRYSTSHLNTGEMYIIGKANGNGWSATTGIAMTKEDSGNVFTAKNVQLTATGSATDGFAFAAKLGATKDDWATVNAYRIMPANSSGSYQVNESDLGNGLDYTVYTEENCNWRMGLNGRFDITVDLDNKKVTITRAWETMYMMGGLSYNGVTHGFNPTDGVEMQTVDGNVYTLSGVTLTPGTTFNFTRRLAKNNDQGGWDYIATYRIGSPNEVTEITNTDLEKALPTTAVGNGGDATFYDFKMATTASNARYLVTLNVDAKTVRLTQMTGGTNNMLVRLEQTTNVTSPGIKAWDKVKDEDPSKSDITAVAQADYTSGDGRKWWTWELQNAIADFYFTRTNGSVKQSETLWRRAGVVYFTWEDPASKETDDETRNYASGAASGVPDCATMLEGHFYVYFINTPGWDNVFCHAWTKGENGEKDKPILPKDDDSYYSYHKEYPGVLCELVGYDDDGYEVYRFDFTEYFGESAASSIDWNKVGIIFNNGVDNKSNSMQDYSTGSGVDTNLPKNQSGDFVFRNGGVYDYLGMLYTGNSLGNLIVNGIVDGPLYSIDSDLEVVYFDKDATETITVDGKDYTRYGALYCKDIDEFFSTQYVKKSQIQSGEIDYIMTKTKLMSDRKRYDQSNWIKLTLSTSYNNNAGLTMDANAQRAVLESLPVGSVLKASSVWGQLVNNINPEMHITELPTIKSSTGTYAAKPNVMVTANFVGTQDCNEGYNHNGKKDKNRYFFVTPKPYEFVHVTWAVYQDGAFYVPARTNNGYNPYGSSWYNEGDLNGYFKVEWDMLEQEATATDGQVYQFDAIVTLDESKVNASAASAGAPRRAVEHKNAAENAYPYIVKPLSISGQNGGVITAVTTVDAAKTVKAVRYYNMAGVESDKPFNGVNIVVTEYSDGSKTTAKQLK